ncbi:MAG: hypothetical protein ACJAXR_000617 [Halopseudomonas sp.]|jgi:hypothetical protein
MIFLLEQFVFVLRRNYGHTSCSMDTAARRQQQANRFWFNSFGQDEPFATCSSINSTTATKDAALIL